MVRRTRDTLIEHKKIGSNRSQYWSMMLLFNPLSACVFFLVIVSFAISAEGQREGLIVVDISEEEDGVVFRASGGFTDFKFLEQSQMISPGVAPPQFFTERLPSTSTSVQVQLLDGLFNFVDVPTLDVSRCGLLRSVGSIETFDLIDNTLPGDIGFRNNFGSEPDTITMPSDKEVMRDFSGSAKLSGQSFESLGLNPNAECTATFNRQGIPQTISFRTIPPGHAFVNIFQQGKDVVFEASGGLTDTSFATLSFPETFDTPFHFSFQRFADSVPAELYLRPSGIQMFQYIVHILNLPPCELLDRNVPAIQDLLDDDENLFAAIGFHYGFTGPDSSLQAFVYYSDARLLENFEGTAKIKDKTIEGMGLNPKNSECSVEFETSRRIPQKITFRTVDPRPTEAPTVAGKEEGLIVVSIFEEGDDLVFAGSGKFSDLSFLEAGTSSISGFWPLVTIDRSKVNRPEVKLTTGSHLEVTVEDLRLVACDLSPAGEDLGGFTVTKASFPGSIGFAFTNPPKILFDDTESLLNFGGSARMQGSSFSSLRLNRNAKCTVSFRSGGIQQKITFETVEVPPTEAPTQVPSLAPSQGPSQVPTRIPSATPSISPSNAPSATQSTSPSRAASGHPSLTPSSTTSEHPSLSPSLSPSLTPSLSPSLSPSHEPSPPRSDVNESKPPENLPSVSPSQLPTRIEATKLPSGAPSNSSHGPSQSPSSLKQTTVPSSAPSSGLSQEPSSQLRSQAPITVPSLPPSTVEDDQDNNHREKRCAWYNLWCHIVAFFIKLFR